MGRIYLRRCATVNAPSGLYYIMHCLTRSIRSWCGAEATGDSERQLSHQDCSAPDQTHCDVDNAAAVAPDAVTSSSSSSSSKLRSFVALVTSVHRPQLARSLGHVISDVIRSSWLMTHRQRAPAAAGDQSAAGDVTCDDVDMTSLLPTL